MRHRPTTVYTSPCGRIEIVRYAPREFDLKIDGNYAGSRATQAEAEYDAHEALTDLLRHEAWEAADAAAEYAAELEVA